MSHVSTKILIARLRRGDEKAFKLIYEQYWSKLYRICYYYTRSREDSEDMLINIFMSLWDNKEKVIIDNPEFYLIKAAKNQSFKYILKIQQQKKKMHVLNQRTPFFDDNDSPEKLLELKELSGKIDYGVQSLPEKTKRIFLLNRENGLTYEEIASSLGLSVKTVEYHISKALSLLSKYLLVLLIGLLLTAIPNSLTIDGIRRWVEGVNYMPPSLPLREVGEPLCLSIW